MRAWVFREMSKCERLLFETLCAIAPYYKAMEYNEVTLSRFYFFGSCGRQFVSI